MTVLDVGNNTVFSYTGTVTFTSSDGQAVLPVNYTFTFSDAGIHTFSSGVTLKTSGSQTVTATDTITGSITGTSGSVTVNPGSASTLSLSGISSPRTAGTASDLTATAKDAYNNTATSYSGTAHFISSDGQAVLPTNYTFVGGDAGTHTFTNGVTLKTAGSQTVTATDTITGSITGTTSSITINPASATILTLSGISSPRTAGVASDVTVTAKDTYNNTATGYTGTVHFTSTDGQAILPSNYAFIGGDSGAHTFTGGVTLKTSGTQTVTGTDTITGSITGVTSSLTVNPDVTAKLVITTNPASVTAGNETTSYVVTRRDQFNNPTTSGSQVVNLNSTSSGSNKSFRDSSGGGTVTFVTIANTASTEDFFYYDELAGSFTISVAAPGLSGDSKSLTINPASTTSLLLTGISTPRSAGVASDITVTAKDTYNNTATGYAGTITFSSSDSQAIVPSNYTFGGGDAGAHTFNGGVTLKSSGSQTVTANDTITGSITGTTGSITVNPVSVVSLTLTGIVSPRTAGIASDITVTAKDTYNNTATGYTGTVHFTSSDTQAALPGDYTFVGGDSGTHTFASGVTLKTSGSQTVSGTDTISGSITGTASAVTVNPDVTTKVVLTSSPTTTTAGVETTSYVVTRRDQFDNATTSGSKVVDVSSTSTSSNKAFRDSSGGPSVTSVTIGNGANTEDFFYYDESAGTYTISITASGLTSDAKSLTVNPAATSSLIVSGITNPIDAGSSSSVTITAKDSFGNITTGYAGIIHFTSTDSAATLPPDYIFSGSDAGQHSFSNAITLQTPGLQTATVADSVMSGIIGSQTITVNAVSSGSSSSSDTSSTSSGSSSGSTAGSNSTSSSGTTSAGGSLSGGTSTTGGSTSNSASDQGANPPGQGGGNTNQGNSSKADNGKTGQPPGVCKNPTLLEKLLDLFSDKNRQLTCSPAPTPTPPPPVPCFLFCEINLLVQINPPGGAFTNPVSALLYYTPSSHPAAVYYTVDGTEPTAYSPAYRSPLYLSQNTTVQGIAIGSTSPIASAAFTFNATQESNSGGTSTTTTSSSSSTEAVTVAASPKGGNYNHPVTVTLTASSSDAQIYYTADGSAPSKTTSHYSAPLTLSQSTLLQFLAVLPDGTASAIGREQYTLTTVAAPVTISWSAYTTGGSAGALSSYEVHCGDHTIGTSATTSYLDTEQHADGCAYAVIAIAEGKITAVPASDIHFSADPRTFALPNRTFTLSDQDVTVIDHTLLSGLLLLLLTTLQSLLAAAAYWWRLLTLWPPFRLTKGKNYTIAGVVHKAGFGDALPYAILTLKNLSTNKTQVVVGDRSGLFGFEAGPGQYAISISKPDYMLSRDTRVGNYHGEVIVLNPNQVLIHLILVCFTSTPAPAKTRLVASGRIVLLISKTIVAIAGGVLAWVILMRELNVYHALILLVYLYYLFMIVRFFKHRSYQTVEYQKGLGIL